MLRKDNFLSLLAGPGAPPRGAEMHGFTLVLAGFRGEFVLLQWFQQGSDINWCFYSGFGKAWLWDAPRGTRPSCNQVGAHFFLEPFGGSRGTPLGAEMLRFT